MNPIAKRIQDARLRAKMTEKELAKKCGLSASYIQQIESGKKIVNETAAAAILKVFGESMESTYDTYLAGGDSPQATAPTAPKAAVPVKPKVVPAPAAVEPADPWVGALAGVIRQYPVADIASGKTVGQKELPVLNKKIEGIPCEKLLFFQASDDLMEGMRIRKGDVVWVQEMKALQEDGVYLIEWQSKRQLYRVQKQSGQLILSRSAAGAKAVTASSGEVRVLGRCLRVEFAI